MLFCKCFALELTIAVNGCLPQTHTSVVWREEIKKVPVWWIVVAIASGLLLLALLSYIFWKVMSFCELITRGR